MLEKEETKGYFCGAKSEFMTAFKNKGRLSDILKDIPVVAVKVDMGVRGAFFCAQRVGEAERNEIISGITAAFTNLILRPITNFINRNLIICYSDFSSGCSFVVY